MKILVVEDNPERMKIFKRNLIGHEVDYAIDAIQGKELVLKNRYEFIFLDHDLGGREFVSSYDINTGYQVAKSIINTPNYDTPTIIHSMNPAGAHNIKSMLPKAAIIPFAVLISKLEEGLFQ